MKREQLVLAVMSSRVCIIQDNCTSEQYGHEGVEELLLWNLVCSNYMTSPLMCTFTGKQVHCILESTTYAPDML